MEKYTNKQKIYKKDYSDGNTEYPPPLQDMINIPSDLNNIQPRSIQVRNWNVIGFDTNGKW